MRHRLARSLGGGQCELVFFYVPVSATIDRDFVNFFVCFVVLTSWDHEIRTKHTARHWPQQKQKEPRIEHRRNTDLSRRVFTEGNKGNEGEPASLRFLCFLLLIR